MSFKFNAIEMNLLVSYGHKLIIHMRSKKCSNINSFHGMNQNIVFSTFLCNLP